MSKFIVSGRLAYVDKFGRNIFVLDDGSAAAVRGRYPHVDPTNFAVHSKLPLDPAAIGIRFKIHLRVKRFTTISTLPHNIGDAVSGVSFFLLKME